MWRALSVARGDIVMFADADTADFEEHFVYGTLGPLLADPQLQFVKAAFRRPFKQGEEKILDGGGRVTELMAKPLINLFYPELAGFVQPLAGEFAARRDVLSSVPFFTGYGVEIGMLIDVFEQVGLGAMAQVDLGTRQNRHQSLASLSRMSSVVLRTVAAREGLAQGLDGDLGRDRAGPVGPAPAGHLPARGGDGDRPAPGRAPERARRAPAARQPHRRHGAHRHRVARYRHKLPSTRPARTPNVRAGRLCRHINDNAPQNWHDVPRTAATRAPRRQDRGGGMSAGSEEFDHIVVGAGSAGCVIARRLVDAGRRVALVEAGGPDYNPAIHQPNRAWELWNSPEDWAYNTEPQQHSLKTSLFWPRGKVLGGSSALNGMIYIRGAKSDFDAWAYNGAPGWSYRDVLPYFKRSEDYEDGADEYHGAGGPLPVTHIKEPNPATLAMIEAAVETGVPRNDDPNADDILGVGLTHMTVRGGRRMSTWTAFIEPVVDSPLLTVITSAQVNRPGLRRLGSRGRRPPVPPWPCLLIQNGSGCLRSAP